MILKAEKQKSIYSGAVAFLLSVAASALTVVGLMIVPALLSCASAGFFVLTLMMSPTSGRKLCIIIPVASAICAVVISSFSIPHGILTLAWFAAGYVIARAAERGTGKTGAVIRADAVFALFFAAAFLVSFFISYKTVAPSAIAETVGSVVESVKAETIKTLEEMNVYELLSSVIDISAYSKETFLNSIVEEAFFFGEIISPAVIITLLNLFSYGVTAFFLLARRITRAETVGEYEKWRLMPTFFTSWLAVSSMMVYILMTLLSRISNSATVEVISYVVLNLVIILVPPMFICGVRGLAGKFRSPRFRGSAILITVIAVGAVVFLPIYGFFYGVMFVALQGAWDMILFYKLQKIRNREDNDA